MEITTLWFPLPERILLTEVINLPLPAGLRNSRMVVGNPGSQSVVKVARVGRFADTVEKNQCL